MKLLRKITLYYQQGNSDKVYEVDLCEKGSNRSDRYLVNFRYGKRGAHLREGTKTLNPVSLAEAEEIYTSIVISKQNKGYSTEAVSQPKSASGAYQATSRQQHLIKKLSDQSSHVRSRAIWRIGELGITDSVEKLIALINKGNTRQDYCIAWALGRLANTKASVALQSMCQHKDESVARIARESWLLCINPAERTEYLQGLTKDLPTDLQRAWQRGEAGVLADNIRMALGQQGGNASLLLSAYQIASHNPIWHQALLHFMECIPMKPNFLGLFVIC